MAKTISISFFLNVNKKPKKHGRFALMSTCDYRATLTITHGLVNTVYNRKRQRSAILHEIIVNLAVFSWLPILCGPM